MEKKLQNQVAVVTGGARGLGRLIALDLARRGANVVIVDLREAELKTTAAEIEALGVKALALKLDLSGREACYRMIAEVREKWGRTDILVNNAGVVFCTDIARQGDEEVRKTIEINLLAQVWATKAALPEMMARKSGVIISIASGAGKVGIPAMGIYCASKFALVGFFDSLRHELRKSKTNIRVIVVNPGFMDTKMFVGAKVPRLTNLFDPQETSTALFRALESGREEVFIPWMVRLLAFLRGLLTPRWTEKLIEFTGLHESFYTSKTVD